MARLHQRDPIGRLSPFLSWVLKAPSGLRGAVCIGAFMCSCVCVKRNTVSLKQVKENITTEDGILTRRRVIKKIEKLKSG